MKKAASILTIIFILVAGMVLPSFAVAPPMNTSSLPYYMMITDGMNYWIWNSSNPLIIEDGNLKTPDQITQYTCENWYNNNWVRQITSGGSQNQILASVTNHTVVSANYTIGSYSNKEISLSINATYYIYNTSELANRTIIINQTGVDKTKQITCTITNPQGLQSTVLQNWQFNSSMISLWQLNPNLSFWTEGNYNIYVSCDGVYDAGVFTLSRTDVQDSGTVTDSNGTSYTVETVKQAYISSPRTGDNKTGRFYIQIKTTGQPYRLPNGKTTYSIYYYFQGNKLINGTLNSDVTMTNKEERYWYSSSTVGQRNLVLYVGENVDGTPYSGKTGLTAKTDISTWQHPESGKWFIPIDIVSFNYGAAATIEDEATGNVSPWQEPGQTAWEAIVNTTQSGIEYTMPGIKFDFDSVTSSIVDFMSGFSSFFSVIGSLFSFIPPVIMGMAITGATLSLALLIFRK